MPSPNRWTISGALRPRRARRGLTLFESLIAIGLLVVTVTAVMSALSAGRQHASEARLTLSAGLAAEMLMARVAAVAHSDEGWSSLPTWDDYRERPGAIKAGSGSLLPDPYQALHLRVALERGRHDLPAIAARIDGQNIRVSAHDRHGRLLAEVVRFIPEPSDS